jgi:deoxyribonuclease V
MLVCVDVHYEDPAAVAAAVLFHRWTDAQPAAEVTERIAAVLPYEPGFFFRRELPCIEAVLRTAAVEPACVVIDGYVWLGPERPGLGAHLFGSLGARVPVVGVAKSEFEGATGAVEVLRGESRQPLFVTAAGIDPAVAADHIRSMSGPHRIPTLLKRVDQLCRSLR